MDKQIEETNKKLAIFKQRMKNANLNLHQVANNFPQTRSIYNKQTETIDGDSIKELIFDYVEFFNQNKILIEAKIAKNPDKVNQIATTLAELYSYYNELVHYADLMLIDKYYESFEKQYNFITNTAFLNVLDKLQEKKANNIIINAKLNILLTILCFQKSTKNSNPKIEQIYFQIYKELQQSLYNNKFNVSQYKRLLLIEAFFFYIQNQQRLAFLSLGILFHEFYENHHYGQITLLQAKAKISLEYIGLGHYPYLTMPLPQDFKNFTHYTLSNINVHKKALLEERNRLLNNK